MKKVISIILLLTIVLSLASCECGHEHWTDKIIESTCTEDGLEERVCTDCTNVISSGLIPAKGHSFSNWESISTANCTQIGTKKRVCTICKTEETREIDIDINNHKPDIGICERCGQSVCNAKKLGSYLYYPIQEGILSKLIYKSSFEISSISYYTEKHKTREGVYWITYEINYRARNNSGILGYGSYLTVINNEKDIDNATIFVGVPGTFNIGDYTNVDAGVMTIDDIEHIMFMIDILY